MGVYRSGVTYILIERDKNKYVSQWTRYFWRVINPSQRPVWPGCTNWEVPRGWGQRGRPCGPQKEYGVFPISVVGFGRVQAGKLTWCPWLLTGLTACTPLFPWFLLLGYTGLWLFLEYVKLFSAFLIWSAWKKKKTNPNTISPLNDVAPSFISFGFLLKAISLYSWSNNASFPHPPSCFLVNPQGCTIPFFCFVFPLEYLWWPDFYYYFLLFNVLSAPLECKCHMRTWILSALYIIVSSVPRTLSRT